MKASLGGALMAAALALPVWALPVWAQGTAGIPGVIAAGTMPELVQETFVFTEGPVAAPDGGLYFTDVRAEKIYRLDAAGKISVLVERSGGANGLSVNRDGEVFWVEGAGKRVVKWSRDGAMTALAASTDTRPFLAPNDLMPDAKGGIYFTDPGPRPVVAGRPTWVFYLPPGSQQPVVLDDQVARPNGLTLTTDGKTLIVADTIGITLFAYDVQPDGTVRNKRTFAAVRDNRARAGERRRRHRDRPRQSAVRHHRDRRAGVRRRRRLSRHHQGGAPAGQRRVLRAGQADALHHRARRSVQGRDAGAGSGPTG